MSATPGEAARLGLRRVLVVCGSRGEATARAVADALGDVCAGLHAEARMHVPVEVADRAVEVAREIGADGCVAVGGGSAIGLGKAIALRTGLPLIAVPSTYSGSEMTPSGASPSTAPSAPDATPPSSPAVSSTTPSSPSRSRSRSP